MGLFDLLFLGTPTLGALVLIGGSLVSGARTRSLLFIIPAIAGILVGVVMLDQFLSYPNGSPTGCLSAGFWLVIGAVAYLIINRRVQKKQPNQ